MRVANCTTPAQYFHLLRRQARRTAAAAADHDDAEEPAAPAAGGVALAELASGTFQPVLDDRPWRIARRHHAARALQRQVYYDLLREADKLREGRARRSSGWSSSYLPGRSSAR